MPLEPQESTVGWSDETLDAFRLAERLFGDAPEGTVDAHVRAALDARGADMRTLAKRVAARMKPAPPSERVLTAPPRVRALLGAPGATPRRRYAPPPGLADTLRRLLLATPRHVDPTWRGRGRAALAALGDEALFERAVSRLGAEEAVAVRTLRTLDASRGSRYERAVHAVMIVGGSTELLGAMVSGYEGARGDGAVRAGRELRATELRAADDLRNADPLRTMGET